jgi:hypothetical protein
LDSSYQSLLSLLVIITESTNIGCTCNHKKVSLRARSPAPHGVQGEGRSNPVLRLLRRPAKRGAPRNDLLGGIQTIYNVLLLMTLYNMPYSSQIFHFYYIRTGGKVATLLTSCHCEERSDEAIASRARELLRLPRASPSQRLRRIATPACRNACPGKRSLGRRPLRRAGTSFGLAMTPGCVKIFITFAIDALYLTN